MFKNVKTWFERMIPLIIKKNCTNQNPQLMKVCMMRQGRDSFRPIRTIEIRVIIMSIGSLIRFILSILIYRINYLNTVGFSCQSEKNVRKIIHTTNAFVSLNPVTGSLAPGKPSLKITLEKIKKNLKFSVVRRL